MKIRLDIIEARLQALIEQWMVPVAITDFQSRLAHQFVQAFQEHLITTGASASGSMPVPPQQFTIHVRSELMNDLLRQPNLMAEIALGIQQAAREEGLSMANPPRIELIEDDLLAEDAFQVRAEAAITETGHTAVLHTPAEMLHQQAAAKKAYFIINGKEMFYLTQAVVNIGRRSDNHLVIQDPRVSREHAQIRFSRGQFVLFDLNSTGGTMVNGQRIRQWTLKPGDVVSLAGLPLIYGEDENANLDDTGNTRSMNGTQE